MEKTKKSEWQQEFDVYENGEWIDTVFYKSQNMIPITEKEVKEDLVNHDGYSNNIKIKEV